jgi:hypothetical protein
MRKLFTWMSFFFAMLVASAAWATPQVDCTFTTNLGKESFDLTANTTEMEIFVTNGSQTSRYKDYFDNKYNVNAGEYLKKMVDQLQVRTGKFYTLRREDGAKLIVSASVGSIIGGAIVESQLATWDLGSSSDSGPGKISPNSLAGLVCTRNLELTTDK